MKNMQNIPKFYDVGLKSVSVSVLPTFQNVGVGVGRHQNHGVGESLFRVLQSHKSISKIAMNLMTIVNRVLPTQ